MVKNNLIDVLKKSYDYWSGVDEDSLECLFIWKKIIKEKPEFLKNHTLKINDIEQDVEIEIDQFLEAWSHAIEEPDFEAAKNSIKKWMKFFENTTEANVEIFEKTLELLENYWNNLQSKNIE